MKLLLRKPAMPLDVGHDPIHRRAFALKQYLKLDERFCPTLIWEIPDRSLGTKRMLGVKLNQTPI
jgi:hypothetical protein